MRRAIAITFAVAVCLTPASAQAFDTGPHADLTRDALTSEGFGAAGANAGMVNNWFVDYYTNPDKNPHSGHASFILGVTRLGYDHEHWSWQQIEGARRSHFDSEARLPGMPDLSNTAGIDREWKRQMYLARKWLRYAGQKNDPYRVMAVVGISLHVVQDFYAHSNWVENESGFYGRGGPGVPRVFGDTPTWFDVPPEERAKLTGNRAVYTGVTGVPRGHGHWQSNRNHSLKDGLNKDWPGRPKYQKAYVTAYFASRQWIRAMRDWLGNEPLWKRAMSLPDTSALRHDVTGAEEISQFSGHWQGGGEPCVPFSCGVRTGNAGSLSSLIVALRDFHSRGPSRYRRAFNELIPAWKEYPNPTPDLPDLPSSRTDQLFTRFVKLEVLNYKGIDLGDPVGEADIYANARMRGQPYTSTIINGQDSFSFPNFYRRVGPLVVQGAYAPFTWIRSVPTFNSESTPVTSMTVRIETGNRSGAGTDDDIHLLIGSHRFSLDKRLYDDFERGDDDTYSVPIGNATRDGLTIGDINRVAITKSPDGSAWYLHGVTLTVNGRTLVRNRSIDRWLENSKRVWTAPGFTRDHRTSDVIPVWLQLREDDFGPQDTGDINVFDRHTSLPIAYRLGTTVRHTVTGAAHLRGRLPLENGDKARLTYRLTSFAVNPPPPPVPPPGPVTTPPPAPPGPPGGPGSPDLVITAVGPSSVTVKNQGASAAGPFNVTITGRAVVRATAGLAAGASTTLGYSDPFCGGDYHGIADSSSEVSETDESNNTLDSLGVVC